jgi:hypothetical protein
MGKTENRINRLEKDMGGRGRPLRVLLCLAPDELTDRELMTVILGYEPGKGERAFADDELKAVIAGGEPCPTLRTGL